MRILSKREKGLIYTAILLLVFYLGNFVIGAPAKMKYEETKVRMEEAELERISLENKLSHGDMLQREYLKKRENMKSGMKRFGTISTGTGLEQHVLACQKIAGLAPVRTVIDTSGSYKKDGYLAGSIEIEAEGSYEASVKILDYLEENPGLYVDTYVLYPVEGADLEMCNLTVRIVYWLPATWEEAQELILED